MLTDYLIAYSDADSFRLFVLLTLATFVAVLWGLAIGAVYDRQMGKTSSSPEKEVVHVAGPPYPQPPAPQPPVIMVMPPQQAVPPPQAQQPPSMPNPYPWANHRFFEVLLEQQMRQQASQRQQSLPFPPRE